MHGEIKSVLRDTEEEICVFALLSSPPFLLLLSGVSKGFAFWYTHSLHLHNTFQDLQPWHTRYTQPTGG